MPKFGFSQYKKNDISHNKKAQKKWSILKSLIPNLAEEEILGFADLSITGNINDYLVFTAEKCYYHMTGTIWTYYYNHPELSSKNAIICNNPQRRLFSIDNNTVKGKDFNECITKLEEILK